MRHLFASIQVICPFGTDRPDVETVRDFLGSLPLAASLLFRFLFWIFYWLPPLIVFRPHTVARLEPDAVDRYLRWWEENRLAAIREGFVALKTVALLAQTGKDWEPR